MPLMEMLEFITGCDANIVNCAPPWASTMSSSCRRLDTPLTDISSSHAGLDPRSRHGPMIVSPRENEGGRHRRGFAPPKPFVNAIKFVVQQAPFNGTHPTNLNVSRYPNAEARMSVVTEDLSSDSTERATAASSLMK